jgi:hypothetical protein
MERFRNSFTQRQGIDSAIVMTGRVINTNLTNWTVDVRSQFERYSFFNIQVAIAVHALQPRGRAFDLSRGRRDVCTVVIIPSDSSPPFVSSFFMPHEVIDTSTVRMTLRSAPSRSARLRTFPSTATFAGGRPSAKPGDITTAVRAIRNFLSSCTEAACCRLARPSSRRGSTCRSGTT